MHSIPLSYFFYIILHLHCRRKKLSSDASPSSAACTAPVSDNFDILDDVDLEPNDLPMAKVIHDHSYVSSGNSARMAGLNALVDKYQEQVRDLEAEISQLKLAKKGLRIGDIKHDDAKVSWMFIV